MNSLLLRIQRSFTPYHVRSFSCIRTITCPSVRPLISSFHSGGVLARKRDNFSFSSKAPVVNTKEEEKSEEQPRKAKRKTRSSAAKNSLRRVAVEAQRSRDDKEPKKTPAAPHQTIPKTVTAICAAEEYDINEVARIMEGLGHALDPYNTELHEQVVHVAIPVPTNPINQEETTWSPGDLFVFPSGTVVAWAVPDSTLSNIVSNTLLPAAKQPLQKFEEEDLEYIEDPKRDSSSIKGDRIILGTKQQPVQSSAESDGKAAQMIDLETGQTQSRNLDTVLAKIAFSSGLARSTKLAVLEGLLGDYFESTKSIPAVLSRGGWRMPFSRRFTSRKTGQLLSIRAQLNLYSELTDSLPDLFWDSRHELGLEGYYDQVGRALDTNIRIKVLNEKMDYAQEIASVLRQHLSEAHGVRLEWIIIALIAVEVVLAIREKYQKGNSTDKEKASGFEITGNRPR